MQVGSDFARKAGEALVFAMLDHELVREDGLSRRLHGCENLAKAARSKGSDRSGSIRIAQATTRNQACLFEYKHVRD